MGLHPTRREILLVIILTVILGLFLQFDLSLRFAQPSNTGTLPRFQIGYGRGGDRDEWYEREGSRNGAWLEDEEDDLKISKGKELTSMSDAKQRWGAEGPARTEVMAHAPGKFHHQVNAVHAGEANSCKGWTVFDSIYLFNGTWFIVTDNPSSVPLLRLMTSTGKEIWNDEESIKGR